MGTHFSSHCPRSTAATERRDAVRDVLGVTDEQAASTPDVRYGRSWIRHGVAGRELTWAAGDGGPDTAGWLLRPAHAGADRPAVLLMHGHDGVKFYGKEKVADGPDGLAPGITELRTRGYGGMAVATGLVEAGFVVLVHDVFPWGSRRVPWPDLPDRAAAAGFAAFPPGRDTPEIRRRRYEAAAREHEHGLAKAAVLAGTSLAGKVVAEDLRALNVLLTTEGVDPNRVAAAGFSGGGARVAHLLACSTRLRAGVITAMMSTFADVANGNADDTTWLMITPGLPAVCDWPEVAASTAPRPLLVQFALDDSHFSRQGMRDAETVLRGAYDGSYSLTTQWFSGGHRFSADMQAAAAEWILRTV
ncbi:hypothetical protein [Rhodococcus jostii]|uniref:Uncharacterized protein n=1 Tax=Rhodococcus jostii TaxID=132919 RepID=A0A1H5I7M0_RHOJO|nr:hypothetical protein [Rhodococcus jostii]SEE36074.1 hypothetical protein SAMN04490220_7517 [Rhodococcus jostii]